ncbi:MAG: hypothetical protein IJV26_02090 [Lachnospiraceae bacterium]|nr:hypothetical protein [Lachnospiraceae bacterium]
MEEREFLSGRVRELSQRTWQSDYLTHTAFLTLREQSYVRDMAGYGGKPFPCTEDGMCFTGSISGVPFVLFGGYEEAERRMLCFLPSYLDAGAFYASSDSALSCVEIRPLNVKFADALTHRDFLGAVMNLGIERDQIGDILVQNGKDAQEAAGKRTATDRAYLFATQEIAEVIAKDLTRVKHTSVSAQIVPAGSCDVRPVYEIREGSVASDRLDAVLAFVFHLSRQAAQERISAEEVYVDGLTAMSAGMSLKPGCRVSVRGFGKFIYEGELHETRKGRSFVRVRVYA